MTTRHLNLSEAVALLREVSDALHQQELNTPDMIMCSRLERTWKEVTAFLTSYDECEKALIESEKLFRATVDALFTKPRKDLG